MQEYRASLAFLQLHVHVIRFSATLFYCNTYGKRNKSSLASELLVLLAMAL